MAAKCFLLLASLTRPKGLPLAAVRVGTRQREVGVVPLILLPGIESSRPGF